MDPEVVAPPPLLGRLAAQMSGAEEKRRGEMVANALAKLGVSESAAKTYGCMLSTGARKPTAIAAALGVSRDEAYRRLTDLAAQGFVSATLTRPIMYVPAEPREVLETLHRRSRRLADLVREERGHLEPLLRKLRCPPRRRSDGGNLRIISGRQKAYDHLHEMLDGATKEFLVVDSHPAAARLAAEADLWKRAQQRGDVGIRVRILVNSQRGMGSAPRLNGSDCQVRVMDLERVLRFSIADQRAMLFFAVIDSSPWMDAHDSAIRTTEGGFIEMENALFWRLWDEARPLEG